VVLLPPVQRLGEGDSVPLAAATLEGGQAGGAGDNVSKTGDGSDNSQDAALASAGATDGAPNSASAAENTEAAGDTQTSIPTSSPTPPPTNVPGLRCLFQSDNFADAVKNAAVFQPNGGAKITAGVVPHHLVAQTLISGLLSLAAQNPPEKAYDTVVIVAPNHAGDIADIIVSEKNWDFGGGVDCDTGIESAVLALRGKFDIAQNDQRMEEDHSASTMIPFIDYYIPGAEVAPVLVSRTLSLDDTLNFAKALYDIISQSGKRVLLLCSIDFSHYLTPDKALANGTRTIQAINSRDYAMIHSFSNSYVDSPASLIIFLKYLELTGSSLDILDHTEASAFLGGGIDSTTSYIIMAGEK